jgi:hypothetical protein
MEPKPNINKIPTIFALYWADYGGINALVRSVYLWGSLVATIILFPLWTHEGWWEVVLLIIPAILGFSLASYAMVIAFGNERFVRILATPIKNETTTAPSVYATTSATFVHFVLVQMAALGIALVCKAWFIPVPHLINKMIESFGISRNCFATVSHLFWFLGFWVFTYAIACGVASTMRIYQLSRWFGALASAPLPPQPKDEPRAK